ncbi:MAG: type III pantothenate kinase [Gammaproteobacteria bacterium]|nr:type III pantothenate kinase [Gammaproteobacteria bacterium]MBU1623463.1 type III pantothenate kinase [Gammaproteobacteria bacterium]MBU1982302.1 type III pantothenate kinase [Gammaproteobacteria bacterium]
MLLLDIGNSRCKWALVENGIWIRQGVLENGELAQLPTLIGELPLSSRILVSNVAGDAVAAKLKECLAAIQCQPKFIQAEAERCGVRNGYHTPQQLGSDRWAALIAAHHRVAGACLVVNCGTATTIDALSAEGEFLGGLILPGLSLMLSSLSANTAQLAEQAGSLLDFPRDTADAMLSGAVRATQGAIQHQFGLLQQHADSVRCLMSGGAASMVMQGSSVPVEYDEHLVLHGLQILGESEA